MAHSTFRSPVGPVTFLQNTPQFRTGTRALPLAKVLRFSVLVPLTPRAPSLMPRPLVFSADHGRKHDPSGAIITRRDLTNKGPLRKHQSSRINCRPRSNRRADKTSCIQRCRRHYHARRSVLRRVRERANATLPEARPYLAPQARSQGPVPEIASIIGRIGRAEMKRRCLPIAPSDRRRRRPALDDVVEVPTFISPILCVCPSQS
jgi:hypothetical protein